MCICTSISSGFSLKRYRISLRNKLFYTYLETIKPRVTFNYGEFAIIKIRIIDFFPYIPAEITKEQMSKVYADEADVLNVAMFGMTARQWRDNNPGLKGNIRDYATINELICLSNLENINAVFIEQGLAQSERLMKLNRIAIHQMSVLENWNNNRDLLK